MFDSVSNVIFRLLFREFATEKIDNESHYPLIIRTIPANVKKIAINLQKTARIGLIILTIPVNVKKICKKYRSF